MPLMLSLPLMYIKHLEAFKLGSVVSTINVSFLYPTVAEIVKLSPEKSCKTSITHNFALCNKGSLCHPCHSVCVLQRQCEGQCWHASLTCPYTTVDEGVRTSTG